MRLRASAITALALAVLLAAAPASGDESFGTRGGTTYVAAKRAIATDRGTVLSVRCPRGTHVVGGGFGSDTLSIVARSNGPTDGRDRGRTKDNGWRATLHASAPDQGVTYAMCRRQRYRHGESIGGLLYFRHTVTATTHCPKGTHVLAGGSQSVSFAPTLVASRPIDGNDPGNAPDDGWAVTLRGREPVEKPIVSVTCGKRRPAYITRSAPIPARLPLELRAHCPEGRHVVGVGAGTSPRYSDVFLRTLAPLAAGNARVPAGGAVVKAEKSTDGRRRETAYAICL